jgi:cytochrome c biogenesis protein CcmG, thiol:disulfide interchange protein DsbE
MWTAAGSGVVVAALISVIAASQPSSSVVARDPLVGSPAPAISGPGLDGGHYSLAHYKGKWVLVNFMASWCVACQEEMPQLLRFSRQYAKSGDALVLTDEYDPADAGRLRSYLAAQKAHWPSVNDPSASVSYGVSALPSSFLVAPSGRVVEYVPGAIAASQLTTYIHQNEAKSEGHA